MAKWSPAAAKKVTPDECEHNRRMGYTADTFVCLVCFGHFRKNPDGTLSPDHTDKPENLDKP